MKMCVSIQVQDAAALPTFVPSKPLIPLADTAVTKATPAVPRAISRRLLQGVGTWRQATDRPGNTADKPKARHGSIVSPEHHPDDTFTSRRRGLTCVHMSILPTMSVEDTPSVRLISRKRPIFFAYSYASVPSAPEAGQSRSAQHQLEGMATDQLDRVAADLTEHVEALVRVSVAAETAAPAAGRAA